MDTSTDSSLEAKPQDIKPNWFKIARRLQSVARSNCLQGPAIVTISALIDAEGNAIAWTEPKVVKVEPKSLSEDIIRIFSGNGE